MAAKPYRVLLAGLLVAAPPAGFAVQHWIGTGERVSGWTGDAPADRLRLGVRDAGVYRVGVGDIALAAGVATNDAHAALANACFALSCGGREVAWSTNAACDALLFYGTPATDIYAPENVYWLRFGAGRRMERRDAAPEPGAATNEWFMHTQSYRPEFLVSNDSSQRRSSKGTLTNVLNFGKSVWGSDVESQRRVDRTVHMPGYDLAAETGVTVRASLCSYRDFVFPDTHECEIRVNNVSCGSLDWSGEQAVVCEYAVPDGALTNSMPLLTVRNCGTSTKNDFMILELELVYPRLYAAAEGHLLCAGGTGGVTRVSGFASGALRVWDVSETDAPLDLSVPAWRESGGDWRAAFLSGGSATRYAVFDEGAGCFEPSVSGVRDIAWHDPAVMPELAIIVPPRRWAAGFAEAAQPLADFRNAQGLVTRIIDTAEIYDAFSDGLVHPEAFRRFAAAGVTNKTPQRLRYMLFAGYGGSDYKLDVFGFSGTYPNLFPIYLLPHVFLGGGILKPAALLLPNDPVLGDVTGDAAPEVAAGRFLATSAAELSAMVSKTINYEISESWKNRAMFTADVPEAGTLYDFTAIASNTAAGFMGSGWEIDTFYAAAGDSTLRPMWTGTGVYDGRGAYQKLCGGAGFFYFIGHSSDTLAGGTGTDTRFFSSAELVSADWPFAPAALLLGCRLGRWNHYNAGGYTVNEAGVRNPLSGFAAVISPAGYMQPADARDYSYAFGAAVGAGAVRLGDAWRGAFEIMGGAASERLRQMTFLGDPAVTIRAGQTARGTSAVWLMGHGLAGDPYADLSDQDGDGFVTWVEYLAGTSPVQGGLRLRALAGLADAASSGVLTLPFETLAGSAHQVLCSTNLAEGTWVMLPWRAGPEAIWSLDAIDGDWPLKSVEVPYDAGAQSRFYKIVAE